VRRQEEPVRALKRSAFLSLMICAWLAASPRPGVAQDDGLFLFKVCNKSSVDASVAVAGRESTDSNKFLVRGWYNVDAGKCADIINLPRGWMYFYAEENNATSSQYAIWQGTDTKLCVDYPGPFERYTGGNSCPAKNLKGFTARLVPQDAGSFTLTLN
jgi:uncharacterized membrane protein